MVTATLVSNLKVETLGLISGMIFMKVEVNDILSVNFPGNFEICISIGHAATRFSHFVWGYTFQSKQGLLSF